MNENITFNNLGMVKCKDFEKTQDDFFIEMSRLIIYDGKSYAVNYNTENNCYEVVYNKHRYLAKCGNGFISNNYQNKELVYNLNQLVSFTTFQQRLQKKYEVKKEDKTKENRKLAQDSISREISNKENAVKSLKNNYKRSRTDILHEVYEHLWYMNFGANPSEGILCTRFALGILSMAMILASLDPAIIVPIFVYVLSALPIVDFVFLLIYFFAYDFSYNGLWASLISLISGTFVLGRSLVKRLKERLKLSKSIKPIKEKIKELKESKNNITVNDIYKKIYDTEKNDIIKPRLHVSIEDFQTLKCHIIDVTDKEKQKEFICELNYILDYCTNLENSSKKKNTNIVLTNMLTSLKENVDKELQKEKEYRDNIEDCNKLITDIYHKEQKIEEYGYQKVLSRM